jgi:RNA polymerase sigma-70 factor (ECF subfamily)
VPIAERYLREPLEFATQVRQPERAVGVVERQAQRADELEDLFAAHQEALLARAIRLCADQDRARDLVQDTLERALRKRAAFVPGTNARAWLMTLLTNLFLDQLRRSKVVIEVGIESHDVVDDTPPDELRVTPEQLRGAVAALPNELREVIELHDLEGLAYRAISDRLGVPMGTVGTRLARARSRLQVALRALMEEP